MSPLPKKSESLFRSSGFDSGFASFPISTVTRQDEYMPGYYSNSHPDVDSTMTTCPVNWEQGRPGVIKPASQPLHMSEYYVLVRITCLWTRKHMHIHPHSWLPVGSTSELCAHTSMLFRCIGVAFSVECSVQLGTWHRIHPFPHLALYLFFFTTPKTGNTAKPLGLHVHSTLNLKGNALHKGARSQCRQHAMVRFFDYPRSSGPSRRYYELVFTSSAGDIPPSHILRASAVAAEQFEFDLRRAFTSSQLRKKSSVRR